MTWFSKRQHFLNELSSTECVILQITSYSGSCSHQIVNYAPNVKVNVLMRSENGSIVLTRIKTKDLKFEYHMRVKRRNADSA